MVDLPKELTSIIFQYLCISTNDIENYKKISKNWDIAGTLKSSFKYITLSLPQSSTDDDLYNIITKYPFITHIDLSGCYELTNQSFYALRLLTYISSLRISVCHQITDGFEVFGSFKCLSELYVTACLGLTDKTLKVIGLVTSLSTLCLPFCNKITDIGLKELRSCVNLTKLDLFGCYNITDFGIRELGLITSLTALNLNYLTKITDKGLLELQGLISLSDLSLSYHENEITEKGMQDLKKVLPLVKITV